MRFTAILRTTIRLLVHDYILQNTPYADVIGESGLGSSRPRHCDRRALIRLSHAPFYDRITHAEVIRTLSPIRSAIGQLA